MVNTITITDGDVLEGYREYYLNSLLSSAFWRTVYPDLWVDAGGSEVVVDGREYFGGLINVDSVSSEAQKLLNYSGVDDAGVADIQSAYAQDGVAHVYMQLSPHQTYTLEGLQWFFTNIVKPTILNSGVAQFSISHESGLVVEQVSPTPYSFKTSPSNDWLPFGTTPLLFDTDINSVIELIYRLTDWFEEFEDVTTTVTGVDGGLGYWTYTTTTVITLSSLSYFSDSVKLEELYNLIHFGDSAEDYYRSDYIDNFSFDTLEVANNAGVLWSYEYGYDGVSGVYVNNFLDRDGLVIYYDGKFFIDKELWKTSSPMLCLLTLGRLMDIGIDEDNVPFWQQFVGFIAGFFDATVNVLGSITYAGAWVGGFWIFDVAENNGLLNSQEHSRQKKTYIKITGTVAFMIIAWYLGGAGALSKMDMFLLAVNIVSLGVDVENDITLEKIEDYNNAQVYEEEESDRLTAVYESDFEVVNLAEYFHDNVYESLDPWADIED